MQAKEKKITIKDIAAMSKVAKSTVSEVINNNRKARVSQKTFEKVQRIIEKYNYIPQGSAKALSTSRTYQIGFLVSSKITLGLSNSYYSTIEAGISKACNEHGYQMLVSTYDISTLQDFVIPSKLRNRSVDGVVVAGAVDKAVLKLIEKLNIPYIVFGWIDDDNALCFRHDIVTTYVNIMKYLYGLNHRRVCFSYYYDATREIYCAASTRFNASLTVKDFSLHCHVARGDNEFENGRELAVEWLKMPAEERFTAFCGNDQSCCGFLAEINRVSRKCPSEISIISGCDTILCEWNSLPITAVSYKTYENGYIATDLLISLIDNRKKISQVKEALAQQYKPLELVIRSTTGKAPAFQNLKRGEV